MEEAQWKKILTDRLRGCASPRFVRERVEWMNAKRVSPRFTDRKRSVGEGGVVPHGERGK
jgi:hypothetical protein